MSQFSTFSCTRATSKLQKTKRERDMMNPLPLSTYYVIQPEQNCPTRFKWYVLCNNHNYSFNTFTYMVKSKSRQHIYITKSKQHIYLPLSKDLYLTSTTKPAVVSCNFKICNYQLHMCPERVKNQFHRINET